MTRAKPCVGPQVLAFIVWSLIRIGKWYKPIMHLNFGNQQGSRNCHGKKNGVILGELLRPEFYIWTKAVSGLHISLEVQPRHFGSSRRIQ